MSPLPSFAAGQPFSADDANTLARQGVITVETTLDRNNLPAPHDGMVCYVEADNTYYGRVGGQWRVLWQDTGLVTVTPASAGSAGFTAQTGWSVTGDIRYRRHGKVVYLYLYHVTRTGGAISVDNKGDITNSPIVQLPNALRPGTPVALNSGATGRMGAGYIDTGTGIVTLAAVGGTENIATNEMFSFGATYLVP